MCTQAHILEQLKDFHSTGTLNTEEEHDSDFRKGEEGGFKVGLGEGRGHR